MKISVRLNQKSIKDAITLLRSYKQIYRDFLEDVCLWIISLANDNLNLSEIGDDIKIDIRNGWEYEVTENRARIWNDTNNAVFVEFGVGKTGQKSPHPTSSETGYQYNIPTIHKYATVHHPDDGTWRYIASNLDEVDLQSGNYEAWRMGSGAYKIITTGSPAVMFAYNAIVTAKNDSENPNGKIAELWEKNLKRYFK